MSVTLWVFQMVDVLITGDTEIGKMLRKVSKVIRTDFWDDVRDDLFENIKRNVQPYNKTGRLQRNVYAETINNGVEGGISDEGMLVDWKGKRVNYGAFIHYGTSEHFIPLKNKKALRWVGGNGRYGFSKGHTVSGIKKDPFLTDAAEETFDNLQEILNKNIKKAL